MAVPELHFFSGNDVNGATILEVPVTEEYVERLIVRPALTELGYMAFRFSRQVGFAIFDSGAFVPETFVRLLVPDVSSTRYLWGCFLNDRVQQLVARVKAGENFDFGGPGPKHYLTRAILWDEQFFGSGYNIDLANGVFRWNETASAGRVLTSLINDDANNTIAEFLPDLTKSFGNSDDSAGNAWTEDIAGNDEFELRIGDNFLTDLFKIEDSGDLETTMYLGTVASPLLRLDAWQGYGRDLSGAIGASTVHFKEAVNILGDLSVTGSAQRKASHVLVEGLEDAYGRAVRTTWDPGEYAKAVGISHDTTKNENVLERYGLAWLRRQANGENEILVPHYPGFSQSTGLYFPGPPSQSAPASAASTSGHYWIGDTVSLTTGGDAGGTWTPLDYRSEDQRVMAITMEMRSVVKDGSPTESALSWNVIAELNVERGSDTVPEASAGAGGGIGIGLCLPGTACPLLTASQLDAETATNGNAENGAGTQWSGGAYSTSRFHAGSRSYEATGTSVAIEYAYGAQSFVATKRYVQDFWRRIQNDHDQTVVRFGVDGGDDEVVTYHGVLGDDPLIWLEVVTGADGGTWQRGRICWTPASDTTGVRFRFESNSFISGWHAVDDLTLYSTAIDEDELNGTAARAAHCDHLHLIEDLRTSQTDPGLVLVPNGSGGLAWVENTAATSVTDHGDLTGPDDDDHPQYRLTTLGGGDVMKTIVAAGSTETLDLVEANYFELTVSADCTLTLAGAIAGTHRVMNVEIRQPPSGGPWDVIWPASVEWVGGVAPTLQTGANTWDRVILETTNGGTTWRAQHGGAATLEADDISDLGFVGELLISDTPSTPLVFADLVQNEAQDDLVYSDV